MPTLDAKRGAGFVVDFVRRSCEGLTNEHTFAAALLDPGAYLVMDMQAKKVPALFVLFLIFNINSYLLPSHYSTSLRRNSFCSH